MTTKHTPGRWFADAKGNIWRRPPSDLYQNGGSVAGDKPLAFAFVGWHGENDTGYPVEANARLIAAAPELLDALQELCEIVEDAIEQKSAKDLDSFTLQPARAAIAKATGTQPAPSEKDEPIRKAWARFSNELHRSPDAPYPGMADAFERHFSQSFNDREWRAESATWAAAWKAAKRHEAPPAPSIPEGWLRAIDEALIVAHIGVANADDTYEQAKAKLDNLIGLHVDVATDPAVNGGWKLVPVEPTPEMLDAGEDTFVPTYTDTPVSVPFDVYRAMLAAAPETKP